MNDGSAAKLTGMQEEVLKQLYHSEMSSRLQALNPRLPNSTPVPTFLLGILGWRRHPLSHY